MLAATAHRPLRLNPPHVRMSAMQSASYVPYIEKTHAYYRRKGHAQVYRYAHHTGAPFTPLRKPLAESRLVLVSSAGFEVLAPGQAPTPAFRGTNTGEKDRVEVWSVPSDTAPERIHYVSGAHNRQDSPMNDPEAYFPLTRLRELHAEGRIGSLAADFLRMRPCYSQRKTRELDAPEILRRCEAMGVDVALLAPV